MRERFAFDLSSKYEHQLDEALFNYLRDLDQKSIDYASNEEVRVDGFHRFKEEVQNAWEELKTGKLSWNSFFILERAIGYYLKILDVYVDDLMLLEDFSAMDQTKSFRTETYMAYLGLSIAFKNRAE